MKVYTAGGMRNNWRDKLLGITGIELINPTDRVDFQLENEYTAWDIVAIKQCDILFAYLEESNPSGVGLALEVGYARGIGKTIIFVDEKYDRYFGMCRSVSDIVFSKIDYAINYLAEFGKIL